MSRKPQATETKKALGHAPLDPQRALELKRYVRFESEDSKRVVEVHTHVAPHFEQVAQVFYERLRESPEAYAILKDDQQTERLRRSLVVWMDQLFRGPHDDKHFGRTAFIGRVHVDVGLPERYMVTAMNVIRTELIGVLLARDLVGHSESVSMLFDLELAVMLDAYAEHFTTRLKRASQATHVADVARAIDNLGVVVIGLDQAKAIRFFNDEAERITGYGRDQVIGKPVTFLFPNDANLPARIDVVTKASLEAFDLSLVTRSGRTRAIRSHLKRFDGDQAGLSMFLTGTDITDELALEERTRQAERLASIGRLAAGLAHEIRNPLNGAHLHLTILERTLKNSNDDHADALESVHTVSKEVQRLSALVTEFLQFAKPQPLQLHEISLHEVCQHAARLLGPEAVRRDITLTLDLPLTEAKVRGDRDKLSQVLINLIQNAFEAVGAPKRAESPIGTVTLRVRRQPRTVTAEVIDDGPGVKSGDGSIFDAFYSTKPQGTGLGLSIAHRIIEDHGGSLTYESRVVVPERDLKQTTFRVELPVLEGPPTANENDHAP
jgi:PAS domain S-box-containing protein